MQLNREGVFSSLNMTETFPVSLITFDNLTSLFLSDKSHKSQLSSSLSHLFHSAVSSHSDLMWHKTCLSSALLVTCWQWICSLCVYMCVFSSLWMKKHVYISMSEQCLIFTLMYICYWHTEALPNQEHTVYYITLYYITSYLCQWNK